MHFVNVLCERILEGQTQVTCSPNDILLSLPSLHRQYKIPLDTCQPRNYSGTETQEKKALLLSVSKAFSEDKKVSFHRWEERSWKIKGGRGCLHTLWKSLCSVCPAAAPHTAGASGLGLHGNVLVALIFIPQKVPIRVYWGLYKGTGQMTDTQW